MEVWFPACPETLNASLPETTSTATDDPPPCAETPAQAPAATIHGRSMAHLEHPGRVYS